MEALVDNINITEVFGALVGIAGGAVAGHLSSRYFWEQNRLKERPRLVIEAGASYSGNRSFDIKNRGLSPAEEITAKDLASGREIRLTIVELSPDQSETLTSLGSDTSQEIQLSFRDVWGKNYKSDWRIEGPFSIEIGEGSTYIEPYSIERL